MQSAYIAEKRKSILEILSYKFINKMNKLRYSEIEVKTKKPLPAPIPISWHSNECYVCMEEFNENRARTQFWKCRHNTCWKCYETQVKRKDMKCYYCNAKQLDLTDIVKTYRQVILPDGEKMFIVENLSASKPVKDEIQQELIRNMLKYK